MTGDSDHQRDRFGSRMAFFFAAVGSAVGFGNVWRFPALAYEYGGGAFFIPYIIALFFIGIPILFLEIALGQYYQRGDVSVFASFHKRMRGVGLSSIVCGYLVLTYYSMLLSWVIRCLFESGTEEAPWGNESVSGSDSVGYFFSSIVGMETVDGLQATRIVGQNVGYSFLTYLLIFICVAFGLEATGRVTYFTMGLPIVLLFIFLIRGCTLDGSGDGIKAYIGEWDMSAIETGGAWSTAVSQIFFSLSVCFGIMTAYGSHMPANEPAFTNSCVIAIANSMFSFFSGFAVFSAIGHQAYLDGVAVDDLEGLGGFSLVFGTWPVVLGSLPGGIHWIRLLFFNLILLGLDSAFSFIEGVVTCVKDTERFSETPKYIIAGFFCVVGFLMSLLYATDAGLFFLDVVDFYINYVLLIVGFFESFGLGWIYDIEGQLEEFGSNIVFTYMFTTFGAVFFACGFWFGLEEHNVWAGFVALILFYGVGMAYVMFLLKKKGGCMKKLAFGNMKKFKTTLEPVIGLVPSIWCFLIKHIVPPVLIILFINLTTTKTADGKPTFGNYGGYPNGPYQILGIILFVIVLVIFVAGLFFPDIFAALDTHDIGEASALKEANEVAKENKVDPVEVVEAKVVEAEVVEDPKASVEEEK
eukprot:CAMPEP_0204619420 /NCGR_PEP_ID=MMETSP0717-20131115/5791_1 /ASSEMBLY_ACC=CAM_ASM_000666 /TAXON_ID=230516 /ORGANISM="Chaetoceros curvisetus" /LENGTH=638 /DNA_ID=CAMNT_0051633419 /DNA_START=28 /DNA_END=1944 /DNA_ORIENTATION=+